MYARDVNRSREAMKRRIAWLDKKQCKTARELQTVLEEQAKLGVRLWRDGVVKAILGCFVNLQNRTPKDTGRLQSGWQMTGDPADVNFVPGTTGEEIRRALAGAVRDSVFTEPDAIYVFNNVEYVLALTAGWSKQQAGNFIDLFLQELRQELNKAATRND